MEIKYYEYHPVTEEYHQVEKMQDLRQDAKLEVIEFIYKVEKKS